MLRQAQSTGLSSSTTTSRKPLLSIMSKRLVVPSPITIAHELECYGIFFREISGMPRRLKGTELRHITSAELLIEYSWIALLDNHPV